MENINKQAVVFIYPNGDVENIPITEYKNHIDYLKEHLEKSRRFAELCDGLDFSHYNHLHIDKELASNGVIVMYHANIAEVLENINCIDESNQVFHYYLPDYFESKEQFGNFKKIYESIKGKMVYSKYSKNLKRFVEMYPKEFVEFIKEAEISFGEEEHTLK